MINNLKLNKFLWFVPTILTSFVAIFGLINRNIYDGLFPTNFIIAQLPQDIFSIIVCVALTYLIITTKKSSVVKPIIIIGIIGALAYLYGIFSIERVYNVLYFVYLAIFGSSFFSVMYSIGCIDKTTIQKITVPKITRNTTAIFSLIIATLFSLLWISALIPLIQTKNQIDSLYSIYILDLVFIMPSFIITAIMTFRKNPLGYLLTPAMFILGIFVILPLGLGELAKPLFDVVIDTKSMMMSFILSGMYIIGAIWQLARLSKNK